MSVVCAIPLQIPVHRMRVTVRCRELGTPLHTTVRRLSEHTGDDELIAATTGLPVKQIERVQAELAHELAPIEREYLIWVDHARGRCLPYYALDGVVAVRSRDGGPTLPREPPTVTELTSMGLSAAASWDSGVDGHVEIDEVCDVVCDIRGGAPSGSGRLSHVLRLPDVHLLVYFDEDQPYEPRVALTQHAIDSPDLTRWAREQYGERLSSDIVDLSQLTEARPLPPSWLTALAGRSNSANTLAWSFVEPHPEDVRKAIVEVAQAATDRLDVCAPDLRKIPDWLRDALEDALARGVSVVLRPASERDRPRRLDALLTVLTEQPHALCVIADTSCAAIHTDPLACLDRGEHRRPLPQHLAITREQPAVCELLALLGLRPPQRRKPSEKLAAQTVRRMLEQALANLADELPPGVSATIEPDDQQAAAATLDRYHRPRDTPTDGMRTAAAGVAWERAVLATTEKACASNDRLEYLASRWSPPQGATDLDLIVADHAKRLVWVIDAKNRAPTSEQEGKMIHQLRLLATHSQFTPDGWNAIGLIVHPARHLPSAPHQTEQRSVLRCNLHDLPTLLGADALPDQRVA
jgi:hypothetical protein